MAQPQPSLSYVHGYSESEATRLGDQADTLAELLHHDTHYRQGESVLEVGCGVGAQTIHLLRHSPAAHLVCTDIARPSLAAAKVSVAPAVARRQIQLVQASIFALPFASGTFDHAFVCFVLEHLAEPERAVRAIRNVVRKGGSLTVIEGDHGSAFFHPASEHARRTIDCLVRAQAHAGGDANIGRRLYPLLVQAGLDQVGVSPRFVYADDSRPGWVDGFTRKTFIAMVEGARAPALQLGLIDEAGWTRGIAELKRSAEGDGTFCYTFFKATAKVR